MNINDLKSRAGFTFVESIVTFSIVGIFLALSWATVSFLISKSGEQIVRTRAHFLAVEGIEIVKQIRKTAVNKNRETGFVSAIGSKEGKYIISKTNDTFSLDSGEDSKIAMDTLEIKNDQPENSYCRTIHITGEGENVKQIISAVKWGDVTNCEKGEQLISYSTYLANNTQ